MGERGPLGQFVRRVLLGTAVLATVICCIGAWGAFGDARQTGAGFVSALAAGGGYFLYWPIAYLLLLPFYGFAAVGWEARKLGWRIGSHLGDSLRKPKSSQTATERARPEPVQPS